MAKGPRVHSDHKALSAVGRSLRRVLQKSFNYSSPVISGNIQQNNIKARNASLDRTQSRCNRNESLSGLSSIHLFLTGILARDLLLSGIQMVTKFCKGPLNWQKHCKYLEILMVVENDLSYALLVW